MNGPGLEGLLFDGRSASATPVRVAIADGALTVSTPEGVALHAQPLGRVRVSEAFAFILGI